MFGFRWLASRRDQTTLRQGRPATPRLSQTPTPMQPGQRYFLWIDGIGGYLLCLSPTIALGHLGSDKSVDVPLLADVSRLHATLRRDAEGEYLLESARPLRVNGRPVSRGVLRHGDRLTLGDSCQLRFVRPSAVSASARLAFTSGHRSLPGVDSILLMAETLVLGAEEQSLVHVPDLRHPIVFFRTGEGLGLQHRGAFTVDGRKMSGRAELPAATRVVGDEFSLALEPVDAHPGNGGES